MRLSLIFCKVAVILSCLLALCACGGGTQRPAAKKALCEMDLPMQGNAPRPMRAGDWMRLLLIGKERSDGIYAEAACTGERIEHVPLPRDCEVQTPDPGVPEAVPLSENSVVERLMPEGRRLIWIMTHRFPNGDGFGPVAAVTLGKTKAEVQSLGFLRLRPMRVDLSLWNIGPKAVLVGEGEQCTDPKVASTCRRAANVLVYDRGRFHAPPIRRTQSGECIDAPWVEYKREADLTLEQDRHRALHPRRGPALLHAPDAAVAAHHPDRRQDGGARSEPPLARPATKPRTIRVVVRAGRRTAAQWLLTAAARPHRLRESLA
jgi:hypothetical protein